MNDINTKCLEIFPRWLESLGEDVRTLQTARAGEVTRAARQTLTGGINYTFKSLDLVPDGIDDIGYLDDAFVIRMASRKACMQGIDALPEEIKAKLGRMSEDTGVVKELFGDELFVRFEKYTDALADGSARGRTVEEILDNPEISSEFANEVTEFIQTYSSPGFTQDEKNIIKLKAFMEARLPK
ncbi:MAG: DUF1232 domain-containing protein [Deltaproteobacteria bacterium]|nr:DUF1232 domain-containing protein [Deltaproteobacteria bacterium]MBN2672920.1 DUF1232 domain-containing protein [Deltaproteobacteria bacterium]